jgi:hypothetical protein
MFSAQTADVESVPAADREPGTILERWHDLDESGPHLLWEARDTVSVAELAVGWSRIGRSHGADIRIDDPTVSRRHALVVRTPDDGLRALDDRSLNGLFVNGSRVESAPLADGDELEIGRFRLYVHLG